MWFSLKSLSGDTSPMPTSPVSAMMSFDQETSLPLSIYIAAIPEVWKQWTTTYRWEEEISTKG